VRHKEINTLFNKYGSRTSFTDASDKNKSDKADKKNPTEGGCSKQTSAKVSLAPSLVIRVFGVQTVVNKI
jgi:hypothetical protein